MKIKNKKIRVGVIMGGASSEHDVSLLSGENVIKNLDADKYSVLPVKISKTNRWSVNGKFVNFGEVLKKIDFAFLALHGRFGEDGKIQALLEIFGVPYNGSGIGASALAMNKKHSRDILKLVGINTPKTLHIKRGENFSSVLNFFTSKVSKFPLMVKPNSGGSSIGVSIVRHGKNLNRAVREALKYDSEVLVEEYLRGDEITCGILGDSALPLTGILPIRHNFFNYKSKYSANGAEEITPAPLGGDTYKKAQEIAVGAHKILGCSGYSRVDMIIKNGSAVYVLEVNTLPGMTETSLLPKQAASAGINFPQLLDRIIDCSLGSFVSRLS